MATRTTAREAQDDLAVFLAEATPGTDPNEASRALSSIRRMARELHRIYERQCNGYPTPSYDWDEIAAKRDEAREEKIERDLRALFARYGLGLHLNGDPRGNPVGILTPKSGRYNTFGGAEDGWRL